MKRTEKKIMRHVRPAEGKHQTEPTCDNCGLMTIRQTASGNHRHCDLYGLFIPDQEMYPSCELHTRMNRTSRQLALHGGVRWETTVIMEGGAL